MIRFSIQNTKLFQISRFLSKSKDYRRPGITENAWSSIAEKLGVGKGEIDSWSMILEFFRHTHIFSVEEAKKRWKSLRDAFIKYYRQELTTGKPFGNKKKTWPFYNHLSYLKSHVELLG
jgi:Adh transcription factor 1